MLTVAVILGLLNTTLLLCAKKWGWIDRMQAYGWIKSPCYLCSGFWMAVIEFTLIFITVPAVLDVEKYLFWVYLTPFCAAAITNYLVNTALINERR